MQGCGFRVGLRLKRDDVVGVLLHERQPVDDELVGLPPRQPQLLQRLLQKRRRVGALHAKALAHVPAGIGLALPVEVAVGLPSSVGEGAVGGGGDFPPLAVGGIGAGELSPQPELHRDLSFLLRIEIDHGLIAHAWLQLKFAWLHPPQVGLYPLVLLVVVYVFIGAFHLIPHAPLLAEPAVYFQGLRQGDHIAGKEAVGIYVRDNKVGIGAVIDRSGLLLVQPLSGVLLPPVAGLGSVLPVPQLVDRLEVIWQPIDAGGAVNAVLRAPVPLDDLVGQGGIDLRAAVVCHPRGNGDKQHRQQQRSGRDPEPNFLFHSAPPFPCYCADSSRASSSCACFSVRHTVFPAVSSVSLSLARRYTAACPACVTIVMVYASSTAGGNCA